MAVSNSFGLRRPAQPSQPYRVLPMQARAPATLVAEHCLVRPAVPLALGAIFASVEFVTASSRQRPRQPGSSLRRIATAVGSSLQLPGAAAPASAFALPDGSGIVLEVLGGPSLRTSKTETVVLLFVHGSYHAAWCWEANFLPFFRSQGYDAYALSLRGQGHGTVPGGPLAVAGTLEVHAQDVAAFVEHLSCLHGRPLVLVGHSFGGLIVQKTVADLLQSGSRAVVGMVLLSSVPPTGNSGLVWRYLWRSPWLAAQITWGFVTRAFEHDSDLCRRLFFDLDMPLIEVKVYMQKMREGCPAGTRLLDLRELQRSLPVPAAADGRLPLLVLGGDRDAIVDREALLETAAAHGSEQPTILKGSAHDAMLGAQWRLAADAILEWLAALHVRADIPAI